MSQTKLSPTLSVSDNEKHESHSFWFEDFQCSIKVDRRKDGGGLAVTLKTSEGKVVINLGPREFPRFVTQLKHANQWNDSCEYASVINKNSVSFRFDYEPRSNG